MPLARIRQIPPRPERETYRLTLRPDQYGELDDVVVLDVECFRMERMSDGEFWLCCYLRGEDDGNRVAFSINAHCRPRRAVAYVTEFPTGVSYEPKSMRDPLGEGK
jgi:hypothetical protein